MRFMHGKQFTTGRHPHDVVLVDDGTLDTVIKVDGKTVRFDQESSVGYRHEKTGALRGEGLRLLAEEACETGMLDEDGTPEDTAAVQANDDTKEEN